MEQNRPNPKENLSTSPKAKPVSLDETIESGTLRERIGLAVKDHDTSIMFKSGLLSQEQKEKLFKSFKTPRERNAMRMAQTIYNKCMDFSRHLIGLRKVWQTEAEGMAQLCTKWDGYDNEAEVFNNIYKVARNFVFAIDVNGEKKSLEEIFASEDRDKYINSMINTEGRKDVTFRVEQTGTDEEGKPTYRVYADIFGEGGLYSKIMDKRERAEEALQALKGAVETFSNFMMSEVEIAKGVKLFMYLELLPSIAETILDYPDDTSYMYDKEGEKYFAFRLRQRRERGETPTPEEERRAVIPDYNQTDTLPEYVESAKAHLRNIFGENFNRWATQTENE